MSSAQTPPDSDDLGVTEVAAYTDMMAWFGIVLVLATGAFLANWMLR